MGRALRRCSYASRLCPKQRRCGLQLSMCVSGHYLVFLRVLLCAVALLKPCLVRPGTAWEGLGGPEVLEALRDDCAEANSNLTLENRFTGTGQRRMAAPPGLKPRGTQHESKDSKNV